MTRRAARFAVVSTLSPLVVAAVAAGGCSFPDATFATDDGGVTGTQTSSAVATKPGGSGNGASGTTTTPAVPIGGGSSGASSAPARSTSSTGAGQSTTTSSNPSGGSSASSSANSGGGHGDGGGSSTSTTTSSGPTTTTSSTTSSPSTTTGTTSSTASSSTSSATMNCDVDGDGYLATGACGGTDCNDNDANVNPGVSSTWVYRVPVASGNWLVGDWNCDGHVDAEYPSNTSCTSINIGALGGGQCSATTGFTGAAPPCGAASDTFVTCQPPIGGLSLVCSDGPATMQTQGCR